jgi:hypothetical protein
MMMMTMMIVVLVNGTIFTYRRPIHIAQNHWGTQLHAGSAKPMPEDTSVLSRRVQIGQQNFKIG